MNRQQELKKIIDAAQAELARLGCDERTERYRLRKEEVQRERDKLNHLQFVGYWPYDQACIPPPTPRVGNYTESRRRPEARAYWDLVPAAVRDNKIVAVFADSHGQLVKVMFYDYICRIGGTVKSRRGGILPPMTLAK
ncbi:hypothetical protein KKG24_04305 [Patescibacteria group bacterium]|nr:hypothetical protein [Patescibacteria group bacterium]